MSALVELRPKREIAVVIAALNAERTIARAVTTALAEPEVAELIVVDDGSVDATAHVARSADDGTGRLKVHRLSRNSGPAAARNEGIARTTAPIIGLLDADDYLLPGRLERLLETSPEHWDMLADDILIVPEANVDLEFDIRAIRRGDPIRWLKLREFVLANISRPKRSRGELGFLKPLMRRSFLEHHGLRYQEDMRLGEDYALYASALARGARFAQVGACGYVAIERADSLSGRHTTADLQRLVDFDERCLHEFAGVSAADRDALSRHQAAMLKKLAHSTVLDARRRWGRLWALAVMLRHSPGAWLYIGTETVRAKLAWRRPPTSHSAGAHLLVGNYPVGAGKAQRRHGMP